MRTFYSSKSRVLLALLASVAGCSKTAQTKEQDPLVVAAAAAIKENLKSPEAALCELTFAMPMTARNVGVPMGPKLHSFCLPEDAPSTVKNCWNALKDQKIASSMNDRFPECLWPINGRINLEEYKAAGIAFACGKFSGVQVTKLDKSEPERLRVNYSLKVEKDAARLAQIERQCGDVTPPPAQDKSVSLFKEGERWVLPGH